MSKTRGMIQYALDKKGQLVFVKDVPRGKDCGCRCPSCGNQLIARQGTHNTNSFAHVNGQECPFGYQTSLHLLAKEIIKDGCVFRLPPAMKCEDYYNDLMISYDKTSVIISKDQRSKLGNRIEKLISPKNIDTSQNAFSVALEEKTEKGFIPDIILSAKLPDGNTRRLYIEIYVTHKVDDEKKQKIFESGVSAVEYDLHSLKGEEIGKEKLKKILETGEMCSWIYNREAALIMPELIKIEEENKKKEIEMQTGYTSRYRIYHSSIRFDGFSWHSDPGNGEDILYNPPCGGVYYGNKCVYPIRFCLTNCPFYKGTITKSGKNTNKRTSPNRTESFIACNRKDIYK